MIRPRPMLPPEVFTERDASIRGAEYGCWFLLTDSELRAAGLTAAQVQETIRALLAHFLDCRPLIQRPSYIVDRKLIEAPR